MRRLSIALGCAAALAVLPASAQACAGADPCPWTSSQTFGSGGITYINKPSAVAVDASGNTWFTDQGNNRIIEVNANGVLQRTFGGFNQPQGIAVGPSGRIWVADTGNNRVVSLNQTTGAQLVVIGHNHGDGQAGTAGGEFNGPVGLTFDGSGNLYVAEVTNNRIQKLNQTGGFLGMVGKVNAQGFPISGTGNAEFAVPTGVAYDAATNAIYVMDSANNRIQKLTTGLAYAAQYAPGQGSAAGQFKSATGIAVDNGSIFVGDTGNNRVEQFTTALAFTGVIGGPGSGPGQFAFPLGVAVNATTHELEVADRDNTRVQVLSAAFAFERQFTSAGYLTLTLANPVEVAVDAQHDVWIADAANSRVVEMAPDGQVLDTIGAGGGSGGPSSKPGEFNNDLSLAFAPNGDLLVADTLNCRIERFTGAGAYLSSFGSCGVAAGKLVQPSGIAVADDGTIYVADRGANRISVYESDGAFRQSWGRAGAGGSAGSGAGQFNFPESVTLLGDGRVVVDDRNNNRLQVFTADGRWLRTIGAPGTTLGRFVDPLAVHATSQGDILVGDHDQRIEALDGVDGTPLYQWSSFGFGPGQVVTPNGITVDGDTVWVTNYSAGTIERFTFPSPSATTGTASPGLTDAALGGTVDPHGGVASWWFEWGTTTAYGNRTTPTATTTPDAARVGATLSGLEMGTTYHARLVARTVAGTSTGDDMTFTTTVPTGPAGATGPTGATGATGAAGPAGPAGVAAQSGPAGALGPVGPSGPITCAFQPRRAGRCSVVLPKAKARRRAHVRRHARMRTRRH